jgi:hypothetical protein
MSKQLNANANYQSENQMFGCHFVRTALNHLITCPEMEW